MLEVNNFSAIRISLASPEQIRSWSYGEVTKPETINYRTLKPEKDGLFCERIFGPTKDFECYCGKYKRIRYKGIVCDKCGVEVTRSKVRRERMGHIELAAPVSHIWFVKGIPSRLGLLLDISPRNLEQVVYFAKYLITWVDEPGRKRLFEAIDEEESQERRQIELDLAEKVTKVRDSLQADELALEQAKAKELAELGTPPEPPPAEVKPTRKRGAHSAPPMSKADEIAARFQAELASRRQAALEEVTKLNKPVDEALEALEAKHDERRAELEEVRPLAVLTEARYKALQTKQGSLFRAAMGAEAVLEFVKDLNLDRMRDDLVAEMRSTSGQRHKKAAKRLRVVEALRQSGNRADWMFFSALPVLPPDLRPMVQLDGGRFATSDLNDLYRRVINRNNRLRRLMEIKAPEIIIRNEKRMLQEAVDSLIDNGRRGRAVTTSNNHHLKSLSDLLRGKQGRFRQNLLGKRVDYSGRSVIVVGPELKLYQCGLPKRMALELFKPFVMHGLVAKGLAHNIKSAKRIVERARAEVWDVLEEVIKDRPILLNRAPTLHRLGIQAFFPTLVDGSAIQIHPLVCTAFNADFDGDQMAVHVPLSRLAVEEARTVLLSSHNMLSPSSGEPVVTPTLDIVLGCYYLTVARPGAKGEDSKALDAILKGSEAGPDMTSRVFSSFDEAKLAYYLGHISLRAAMWVRDDQGRRFATTVGRILFNEVLPAEMRFKNEVMDKKLLKKVVSECCRRLDVDEATKTLDALKRLGFTYATQSGLTIAVTDIEVPETKPQILAEAERKMAELEGQFQTGLIGEDERYQEIVKIWSDATDAMTKAIEDNLSRYGSIYMMATSGAKGNITQIRQMAGMRGLMSDPSGRIIDLPIRSSFREGLTVLEYFISTHGARKGLADTALRTADSGYLTRRLIDVSQDVIILEDDCGSTQGIEIARTEEEGILPSFEERLIGRLAVEPVVDPQTGQVLAAADQEIDEETAAAIQASGVTAARVRSPLTCQARRGLCQKCYGRSPATGKPVEPGEATGIVAAQSIGEPGTQLTMRTFHTGGVVGLDITSGLPRVEELFEARAPKGQAVMAETEGQVEIERTGDVNRIRVVNSEHYRDEYVLPPGQEVAVQTGQLIEAGAPLVKPTVEPADAALALAPLLARVGGHVEVSDGRVFIAYEERDVREYVVPAVRRLLVKAGAMVRAGDQLTEGALNPQEILRIRGREAVQRYMVDEVQKVYRTQGVAINNKHIEVIVRQMLRRVYIKESGDTDFLTGELVDRFTYEEANAEALAKGGEPATAEMVLLGVTKAALNTESFLARASFQETTRVLTEAALAGEKDGLLGLKENVIIGRLIPAQCLSAADLEAFRRATKGLEGVEAGEPPQYLEGMMESL